MIKIGMIIGDRYEILEKIGTGGMSDVYKATCHKLKRYVAVKVLKQEFSENANFVSKFRIEAQAAAGLMHPNIVNVYDVGEENGIYYIVMELVEGITLKKYIVKKARLSVKESISIAIQVSMGIEAAHNNNIIHRDIKPQNIIISKDGKVKVMDFGIAKAATSNTVTSNVMGSVHYTSPEQARGGYSDQKSDVYSLGITFFEMLTGRVPFNGETTVAIAIKHIQEEMPSPREFVPEIPISVEQIVYKCTQKSPDRRYHTVPELVEDLKQSLMYPDEDFVKVVDFESQEETRMIPEQEIVRVKRETTRQSVVQNPAPKLKQPNRNTNNNTRKTTRKSTSANTSKNNSKNTNKNVPKNPRVKSSKTKYEEAYNPKKEKTLTIFIIFGAVLIGCLFLFFVGKEVGLFPEGSSENTTINNEKIEMIDILGLDYEIAKGKLDEVEINHQVTYEKSSEEKEGVVLETSVIVGEMINKTMTVIVTVSAEIEGIFVPSVVNVLEGEATVLLSNELFTVEKEEAFDDEVKRGYIISQDPKAGSTVPKETTITIIISKGPEENKVTMPSVLGMTLDAATATLEAEGLKVGSAIEVENGEYATATVCYQSYSVGTSVPEETAVDIQISKGGTYRYIGSIVAPEDYETGSASIVLTADNGVELYNNTYPSFPVDINVGPIRDSQAGELLITFYVTVEAEQEVRIVRQPVVFTKE